MAKVEKHLVGVDVGSSKVDVLIVERDEEGRLEIAGRGRAPNRGTRRGNIVNVDATVDALKKATEDAEKMAGVEVSGAYVGIAGADIRSVNSRGMVYITHRDREIARQDVQRVLDAAQSASLPSDREILHAIPQEFVVDDQSGIAEPVGMLGSRLEANVHLVTGHVTRSKTLLSCVNRAGIEVISMVFEPLATAEAILLPDERELGALVLEIGSGTTGYALYVQGEVHHSGVLPIGASHFTSDLAMVLRTPFAEAERIKVEKGCCLASLVEDDEGVTVPAVGGGGKRVIPRAQLIDILQPRAEEIFQLIHQDLHKNGCEKLLRGGVVVTGGGAQLTGVAELAEQVFATSVRYGLPQAVGGLVEVINDPSWSTAAGLVVYGQATETSQQNKARQGGLSMRSFASSLRGMFSDLL